MEKLDAAFDARARRLDRAGEVSSCIRPDLPGLDDAHLSAESGGACKGHVLLEANLRQPEPQIAGSSERRNGELRERTGLAWIENRLFDAHQNAALFPVELDGAGSQTHGLIRGAGGEIHVDGPADIATPDGGGPTKIEPDDRLPPISSSTT